MKMPTFLLPQADWLPLLAEIAAKATFILLLAALATALLWRASAAVRHLVWCVGVVGVLSLPFFTLLLPEWEVPVLPAAAATALDAEPAPLAAFHEEKDAADAGIHPAPQPSVTLGAEDGFIARGTWWARVAAAVAFGGMVLGALWLGLGFWGVARLGRRAEVVRDPEWLATAHEAAEQLGLRRPVLLLRARGAVMPATGGLLWPSVVIPATADQWPGDRRRAVLAHELAHVKRFDTLTQMLAQLACVLFWWHPAVWYAARRLRVERERACDDLVLGAGTRASDYASHLLEIARTHRGPRVAAAALVSMARPSQLESRLLWVLDAARARRGPSARATLLTVGLGLLVVVPLAAARPTQGLASANGTAGDAGTGPASPVFEFAFEEDQDGGTGLDKDKKAGDSEKKDGQLPAFTASGAASAVGDTNPSVDDLVAMRAVGVDARYIAEMRDAGYTGLTARELVGMAAVDVTGAYAREMNALGWGRLTPQQLSSLAAQEVDREYVEMLRRLGFRDLSAGQVAGMAAMGVDAAFVEELRRHGYTGLSASQVTALRSMDVDGRYIQEMNALGFGRLTPEQLSGFAAVEVTPAYVRELEGLGLRNLTVQQVQSLRSLDVDADFVREMRAAGFQQLDPQTLTSLAGVGVTEVYVRGLASAGLDRLTAREVVALRANDVTPEYIRELEEAGFRRLSADELIRMRHGGVDRGHVRDGSKKP